MRRDKNKNIKTRKKTNKGQKYYVSDFIINKLQRILKGHSQGFVPVSQIMSKVLALDATIHFLGCYLLYVKWVLTTFTKICRFFDTTDMLV